MVRKYKRKLGARRYVDYTEDKLNECLKSIRDGTFSHRKAAAHYGIPRRTILNKLKNKHEKQVGGQPVFSRAEEESFVSYIETMSDYGFPLMTEDLRHVIKSYLDRIDRKVKFFTDNKPGLDWMKSFLKRFPRLKERIASNIKRGRAAVTEDTLKEYIDNLKEVVKDVPPENIWNLDETNLSDDPSRKKVICRRGVKYPERVCNFSKSSTSVMMCGSASGELLPPFVVYKALKMWDIWVEGGPKGARYSSTKSGWFDSNCFNEWFDTLLLPKLKKLPGKRVVIADNLSSHLNVNVFQKCKDNDISFVCLPPNSTHLTQPLDVAFFRPMKVAWRTILSQWKETADGANSQVVSKQVFPSLLKKVLERMEPNMAKNLESGFRKCGIYPCDIEPLLQRVGRKTVEPSAVSAAFLEVMNSTRSVFQKPASVKRKKINLPAGKSLSHEDVEAQKTSLERQKMNKKSKTNKSIHENTSEEAGPSKLNRQKRKNQNLILTVTNQVKMMLQFITMTVPMMIGNHLD